MTQFHLIFFDANKEPDASVEFMLPVDGPSLVKRDVTWGQAYDLLLTHVADSHGPGAAHEDVLAYANQFVGAHLVSEQMLKTIVDMMHSKDGEERYRPELIEDESGRHWEPRTDDQWRDRRVELMFDYVNQNRFRTVRANGKVMSTEISLAHVAQQLRSAGSLALELYETAGLENTIYAGELYLAVILAQDFFND